MVDTLREFHVGPDPDGRAWSIRFLWLQTAISIRMADAVDVKFLVSDGDFTEEKVIALPHPLLRDLARRNGHPLTDPWCMRLASAHLKRMIETGEDIEKTLVTLSKADLERAAAEVSDTAPAS
jgi:hypothetical protein